MAQLSILALGSRGDVQPFVALASQLQRLGHRVRIAAATDYRALVEDKGLDFAPIGGSIRALMDFD
ncbi:MAG: glycosyltransferase, partial [Roseiflexaceae bacterium]|nr:glycosyltransferase [Roseiflexaceae bacterium]